MHIHTTPLVRVVSKVAATGLVVASASFGGAYAYRVGIHGGMFLAGITILFAVALELAKPLAITQAFQCFGEWRPVRGLFLSVLGVLAVAYSLTSELALMAGSRGDLAAQRASVTFQEL